MLMRGSNVAIVDIPGAYFNTGKPKDRTVLLKWKGKSADNVQCGQLSCVICEGKLNGCTWKYKDLLTNQKCGGMMFTS